MSEITDKNFGLLIAYLIPGFVTLSALSRHSETVGAWLGSPPSEAPTVGGFLYITLASVGAGMVISALRWFLLDRIHHETGLQEPERNFATLQANLSAFEAAVTNHFRHYQFFGHMLMAMLITAAVRPPVSFHQPGLHADPVGIVAVALAALLFLASRDALARYYARTAAILSATPRTKGPSNDQRLASQDEHERPSPPGRGSGRETGPAN